MRSFSHVTLNIFFGKFWALLNFGSCQNYMNSVNLVAYIQLKLSKERTLSTRE